MYAHRLKPEGDVLLSMVREKYPKSTWRLDSLKTGKDSLTDALRQLADPASPLDARQQAERTRMDFEDLEGVDEDEPETIETETPRVIPVAPANDNLTEAEKLMERSGGCLAASIRTMWRK